MGTLGDKKKENKYINVLFSSTNIPEDYVLTFDKQVDRLVINGTFYKESSVHLILDNILDQKSYRIYVTKTPYTAVCIDVFNNYSSTDSNMLNINYYINEENLSGRYNIYLKVDDKVYNTNEYVIFE